MAEYDIDRLQIEIESSASNAVGELNALTEALEGLQAALSGSKLPGAADDMDELGDETEGVDKALRDAKDSGLKFGDVLKANVLSDAIMSGVRALGNALADIGRGMVDFAKDGIGLASDLEEVQNVVDVTFGDGAAQIGEFAKAAATGFGMSELSAKQFTGTMGAMLKSMGLSDDTVMDMSTSLTALAGDMASFYNLDPETAFEKLRAGISGETEPLKQLGINMSVANLEAFALAQGIETAYKEMTQAEQAALRYSYLMQATADAQGDFARTSDSYANQQRILQLNLENLSASIGSKLLPTVNKFTKSFNGLLSGNSSVSEFFGGISSEIASIATEIANKIPELLNVAGDIVKHVAGAISAALPKLFEAGKAVLQTLINAITEGLPTLIPNAVSMIMTLATGIAENLGGIVQTGVSIVRAIVEGIINSIPVLIAQAPALISGLLTGITEGLTAIREGGINMISGLIDGIAGAIPMLAETVPQIIDSFVSGITGFLEDITSAGNETGTSFLSGILEKIPDLIKGATDLVSNIIGTIAKNLPKILETGVKILLEVVKGILKAIPELVKSLPKIITAIVQGIGNLLGSIVNIGVDIVKGIWEGIKKMATWIKEKVSGFFSGIVDGVKGLLGIHSPSRVFAGIGGFMAEGLGSGWANEIGNVQNRIARSVSGLIPDLSVSVPVNGMRPAMASAGYGCVAAPSMRSAASVIANYSAHSDNSDVVGAVYSIGRNIVEAVRNQSGDIYMDSNIVGKKTTAVQNRANRMYGKSLQNT